MAPIMNEINDIKISEDVLKKATMCSKNLSCLNREKRDMCRVEYAVSKDLLFVKKDGVPFCNYRMFYGDGAICKCPVRIAIYERYHI